MGEGKGFADMIELVKEVAVLELTSPHECTEGYLRKGWILLLVFYRPGATFPTWVVGRVT